MAIQTTGVDQVPLELEKAALVVCPFTFLLLALKSAGADQISQKVSDTKKKTHQEVPQIRLSLGNLLSFAHKYH